MARPVASDYFQNYAFHVVDPSGELLPAEATMAGFSSVTVPEFTKDAQEYREGIYHRTRKYPGFITVGDVTLSRGVAKRDSYFADMIFREGDREYRSDLTILHYHRTDDLQGGQGQASREYHLLEAFCTRFKPAGDLDATASDISVQEVDLAVEDMEIVRND